MCGITGYFVTNKADKYSSELKRAVLCLKHRGPDNQAIWLDKNIGLAHTRLAILDLSEAGNQPMVSNNGRYIICYNGQVYNYIEIANQLKSKFKICSDTRVILEAISELGVHAAVPLFNGMFAFALWDKLTKTIYLVRDSIGIKPLYWGKTNDGYIFSSEIKALRNFSSFKTKISSEAELNFFKNKAIYAPDTIYSDCYKLEPGNILSVRDGKVKLETFLPKTADYSDIKTIDDAQDCLENLLKESILRHSRSDVPFSAFLSGGIDSSLIVSILSQQQSVRTYSVGYEDVNFDESIYAEKVSKHLGLEHEKVIISPKDISCVLDKIANIYDEPFADSSCIPTYLLSKQVAKHTKIAFSGDGADELFAGYPRYMNAVNAWRKISFLPFIVRNNILKKLIFDKSKIMQLASRLLLNNPRQSLPYLKKLLGHETIWECFSADNSLSLPANVFYEENTWKLNDSVAGTCTKNALTHLQSLLRQDVRYRLPDEMLTKVDRASMASSLEVRVPFLDNEIVKFSQSLPDEYLVGESISKLLLKRILAKHLPLNLFERPKVGFHIPLQLWLRDYYKDWAEHYLFGEWSKNSQFRCPFNMLELKKLWQSYLNGNNELFYPLWSAIIYKQWISKLND